jgi:hypothetical protein
MRHRARYQRAKGCTNELGPVTGSGARQEQEPGRTSVPAAVSTAMPPGSARVALPQLPQFERVRVVVSGAPVTIR